jgi:hypothetical protein
VSAFLLPWMNYSLLTTLFQVFFTYFIRTNPNSDWYCLNERRYSPIFWLISALYSPSKKSPPERWSHGRAKIRAGLIRETLFDSGRRCPQGLAIGTTGNVCEIDGVCTCCLFEKKLSKLF